MGSGLMMAGPANKVLLFSDDYHANLRLGRRKKHRILRLCRRGASIAFKALAKLADGPHACILCVLSLTSDLDADSRWQSSECLPSFTLV